MKDQGFREIFKLDNLGLKQINDTLRALWKKVMGGLDWRDLATPTQEIIDGKASREEMQAVDQKVLDKAEELRNYAETIEAKADAGVDGVLQVREDLKLYSTTEQTEALISSEVLRVEGETDDKLKNYSTLQQTADGISSAVAEIRQDLTNYSTISQTDEQISAVVAEVDSKLGGYASIDMMQDQLALKVSTGVYEQDRIYRQETAPANPVTNLLWLDTSVEPNQLRRWTGSAWVVVNETDVGGRNYVRDSESYTLTAAVGNDYQYWTAAENLDQGQLYTLSVARIVRLAGSATQVRVTLYDYDSGAGEVVTALAVSNDPQHVQFTPPVQAGRSWSLLLYAGMAGATSGNSIRFERVKLEKGNVATDWTPAPEDPAAALATHNGITLNRNGVFIDTNRFDLNLLNSYGETVLNMSAAGVGGFQQLRAQRLEVADLYVAGMLWRQDRDRVIWVDGRNGSNSGTGASTSPYKTIQYALSQVPKCVLGTVTVYIQGDGGYVYDGFELGQFYGPGRLWITDWTDTLYKIGGAVVFNRCACEINLRFGVLQSVTANYCSRVLVTGCTSTQDKTQYAASFKFEYCGVAIVNGCIGNAYYGVLGSYGTQVHVINVVGTCPGAALAAADGAIFTVYGTRPAGSNGEYRGGKILNDGTPTADPNDPAPPPTPTETTTDFACASMATYRTGSWRTDSSAVGRAIQAHYSSGSSGNNIGCFFFGFGSLSGKAIKSATISLSRPNSGGSSGATTPYIGVHALSSASGTPSPTNVSAKSPGLAWGETRSYDITSQMQTIAASGGAGGLCLYDSGNSASHYMVITDKPTVTVTYT